MSSLIVNPQRHKASMDDRLPLKMRQYFKTNQSNFPLDTRIVGLDYEEFIREGNRPSSTLSELKIPKKLVWMRALGELGDDPQIHKCVAAWASDWGVGVTPMKAVGSSFVSPEVRMCCSLDHAMWFNGDFRADEWMLYEMEGIQFAGGRGVSSGRIYDQEGNMKVHVTQEILIRYKPGTEYPKFDKTLQW
ncbi:hypothetical protein SARC_07316 [Sphaeroforma arctica JP610]|uniref:Acyl-CoA thioesterase 2 C-terminal domain-containing protein n=1 Tax=Sphaeroforma arctica JP610 TaxID=667725 RepID=A0A0L0FU05_9EUKA|nr:hypothetical protein SARC_07316 [Sphaeroforma arctica JP610]KNC80325.1 hypothetical protein SARC_07316 [Sphaeroforma arctica JP610]|eukprot:XP_014154227.1 hypothetical protein SARC_07316 [Sphaeroforma arctica JP610]